MILTTYNAVILQKEFKFNLYIEAMLIENMKCVSFQNTVLFNLQTESYYFFNF